MTLLVTTLNALAERPIPIYQTKQATNLLQATNIDCQHVLYQEKLTPLKCFGLSYDSYYAASDGHNPPYYRKIEGSVVELTCRQSVGARLSDVNSFIAPLGLELHVWDAFRTIDCQKSLWNFFVDEAKMVLRDPTYEECASFAAKYCSDPNALKHDIPSTWPTHLTGGAIDLTLKRRSTGELLFMGGVYDDPDEISHVDFFETESANAFRGNDSLQLTVSEREAQRNRRLLYHAMIAHGFSNYPYEWWHYDWGNAFWVANWRADVAGAKPHAAFYNPILDVEN